MVKQRIKDHAFQHQSIDGHLWTTTPRASSHVRLVLVSSMSKSSLEICSVDNLPIEIPPEIRQILLDQYDGNTATFSSLLAAMKRPPVTTICRVNNIITTREHVEAELLEILKSYEHLRLETHAFFDDVLCIVPREANNTTTTTTMTPMNYTATKPSTTNGSKEEEHQCLFTNNEPWRQDRGWPMSHRVVLCDRFCGEAVLRGSDIFVRGILAADAGIQRGDVVAVYADIRHPNELAVSHGMLLEYYHPGRCVYLGIGTTLYSRSELFRMTRGVAIRMSHDPQHRVGPCMPPLSRVLQDKMMLQNLPSILVGHALQPQPNDTILDMCAAPGGKSAHLASLVKNQATIISCDKSRKKILDAMQLFQTLGATCITPLALDTTKCLDPTFTTTTTTKDNSNPGTIRQIVAKAELDASRQLKTIQHFPPDSFDRILLDPPCSALGLRPKLFVPHTTVKQFKQYAVYQRKFILPAVTLLKPGGFLSYSTCTINTEENEEMVKYILDNYPSMQLIPLPQATIGLPGRSGFGLNDCERGKVRRFEPQVDDDADTIGFFVALFQKSSAGSI